MLERDGAKAESQTWLSTKGHDGGASYQVAAWCYDSVDWSQPGGPTGDKPPERTEAVPVGSQGKAGQVSIEKNPTLSELAEHISLTFMQMVLRAAERDYVNNHFDFALNKLIWSKALISQLLRNNPGESLPEKDRYVLLQRRADTLIDQLRLGLDYFGLPKNFVTLLSVNHYTDLMESVLSYATDIEAEYLAYYQLEQDAEKAKVAFQKAQQIARSQISSKRNEQSRLVDEQQPILAAIERLAEQLNDVWYDLLVAEKEFRSAVELRGRGCDFMQIVSIAAAVATLVATGGSAAPAIALAWDAVQKKPLKYDDGSAVADDFKGFKYKVNVVAKAGDTVQSFVKAFDEVKDKLAPKPAEGSDVPALPSDEAKILASAESIEKQLKPFLGIGEARRYDALIRAFVATAEARNNKILEYNNLLLRWQQLGDEIETISRDSNAAQDEFSLTNDPFVAEAANFMEKAWLDSKAALVRLLHQLNQAIRFYSLTEQDLTIEDFSVGALKARQLLLLDTYTQRMAEFGAEPANIQDKKIDIMNLIPTKMLEEFRKSGRVFVAIDPNHQDLAWLSFALATKVSLELEDSMGPALDLQASFTHEGRSLIFDRSGRSHTFSHVPVSIPYERKGGTVVVDGSIAGGQTGYVGLSPYGPWTIQVWQTDPGMLARFKKISLVFSGKGRSRVG